MANVILRQEVIDDLNNIWLYTFENWSENQADKYYSMIKLACNSVGINPRVGRDYSSIKKNLLGLNSGKHIIFYFVVSADEIEVVRILHESIDSKNRLVE